MLIFVFIVLFSFRIYNLSSGVGLLVLVSTYLYIFETAVHHKSPEKPQLFQKQEKEHFGRIEIQNLKILMILAGNGQH